MEISALLSALHLAEKLRAPRAIAIPPAAAGKAWLTTAGGWR